MEEKSRIQQRKQQRLRQMRNKRRRRKFFGAAAVAVLVTVIGIGIVSWLPEFGKVSFFDYYSNIINGDTAVVLEDEVAYSLIAPVFKDNEVYIPVEFIKNRIDEYIFWDRAENTLTITTEKNVIRMQTENLTYYVNNEPMKLSMPVYNIDGFAYMPAATIEDMYNMDINYSEDSKIVSMDYRDRERTSAFVIADSANIRYKDDKKSPVETKALKGDSLIVYEKSSPYSKVKTADGYVGYINTQDIGDFSTKEAEQKIVDEKKDIAPVSGKINVLFDQVFNVDANNTAERRTPPDGVDVLVPTWFSFKKNDDGGTDGEIINIADKSYVDRAHARGCRVWGLITDNFDSGVCHSIISSTEKREYVIKQLLAFVSLYDLDGVNIDFESVPKNEGAYFIQFMRELGAYLNTQGAALSVDVYIPRPWTSHYNRGELGKIVDYFIVMGYDQHTKNSEESGSVATIEWSRESITATADEGVPKEKLILGIPFYTRIWEEKDIGGSIQLSTKAYGMEDAYDIMTDKGAEFEWLPDAGQNFAQITEGDITYKMWLEDEKSVEERVKLVMSYDAAGVAAWKRGFEKQEVWGILKKYLKG